MELQYLRDLARDKESEASDHYFRYAVGLDPHALATGYACEMEAKDVRARIAKIEATPEPPAPKPEPKPVKCYYPEGFFKRK